MHLKPFPISSAIKILSFKEREETEKKDGSKDFKKWVSKKLFKLT
jgi:hypothetical protein